MAKANFEVCMVEVKTSEGGYVNHPKDPGGETNYGISKRSYPSVDIKRLTWDGAKAIYRRDFWNPIRGDELPAGVDYSLLDPAINSGVSRAVKFAQGAIGVTVDGKMGPKTLQAIQKTSPVLLIQKISAKRSGFLRGLKTWNTFGKGWSRRVAHVEAVSLRMAGVTQMKLLSLANEAKGSAVKATNQTTGVSVVGAGGGAALPADYAWVYFVALAVVFVAMVGVRRHALVRAEALQEEAKYAA